MTPKGFRFVMGADFSGGRPSQTFYSNHPRFYPNEKKAVCDREQWGIELLVDLRASMPGPEQDKYQKVQLAMRKAKASVK